MLTKDEAIEAVIRDSELIWEEEFHHCVIEGVEPGHVVDFQEEVWFVYDKGNDVYKEIEKPEQMRSIVGFAIG